MKKICIMLFILISLSLCSCSDKKKSSINAENGIVFAYLGGSCYDNGMIYGSDPMRFVDFDTMESSVLCAKPNCNHKGSECVAKLVGDCPIMYKATPHNSLIQQIATEKRPAK